MKLTPEKKVLIINTVKRMLEEILAKQGGNKKVVASELGLSRQYLYDLLEGKFLPSDEILKKMKDLISANGREAKK